MTPGGSTNIPVLVGKLDRRSLLVCDDIVHEWGATGARVPQPHSLKPKYKLLLTVSLYFSTGTEVKMKIEKGTLADKAVPVLRISDILARIRIRTSD